MTRVCGLIALLLLTAGCERGGITRVEWPVMGTIAAVQFRGPIEAATVESVKATFAEIENLMNAHEATSEIRRLAACDDAEVLTKCSPHVKPCYAAAFKLAKQTDSLFNPRWRGRGTLDLGAIAKGFAVDCAAQRAMRLCSRDWLIDLGGNLKAVRGRWRVQIAETGGMFDLAPGAACATSSERFRGKHIRDGRTGAEISDPPNAVTVVHPTSAMWADGLSTVCFLLGKTRGEEFLRKNHPTARARW